jgi:tryptophan-rich sensory protein
VQFKLRLLVADDHDLVREALIRLFDRHPQFEVVAVAADADEAIDRAAATNPPIALLAHVYDWPVLRTSIAAWISVATCAFAAIVEGLCAGRGVRHFFESVRCPRYSPPLWLWSIIGGLYYLVFGFVIYRLLSKVPPSSLTWGALALTVAMMFGNGLSNLVIFRRRDLRLSRTIGNLYALLDILLLFLVSRLDAVTAWVLVPYLVYRAYAVWWGDALARLNPPSESVRSELGADHHDQASHGNSPRHSARRQ